MATSNGMWSGFNESLDYMAMVMSRKSRSKEPKPQRKHHYKFDVDDNGLDINGFILHTDKHKGKRHKFRVYLDSNENNRFDKDDQLIGRTGLKQKHAAKGVGNLLDEDELGQLEVTFKKPKSNPSMRSFNADDMERGPLYQSGDNVDVIAAEEAANAAVEATNNAGAIAAVEATNAALMETNKALMTTSLILTFFM